MPVICLLDVALSSVYRTLLSVNSLECLQSSFEYTQGSFECIQASFGTNTGPFWNE